jgi:hypothetical protein
MPSFARARSLALALPLVVVLVAFASSCAWEYRMRRPAGANDSATLCVTAPSGRPVVALVVDQMGAWIARERWPLLPADGGFARLLREGTYATNLRYAHAVTDTAPGHSALYTGATPRESGIVLNETLAPAGGKFSILRDTNDHLVGAAGAIEGSAGASLAPLSVGTVADALRGAHPDALVVSLSIKDRGALFGGGRNPTASLWLDLKSGGFVCSSSTCGALPAWAAAVGSPPALARLTPGVWEPLDRAWVTRHAATPDAQDGEGDAAGLGVTFPHRLAGTSPLVRALRTTPTADDVLFDLALSALDAEWKPGRPTLLALSLSANDYVGHTFGPDSWEAWDELERLDASLGRFLHALDARFGPAGYDVLLTADHGVTTMPEAASLPGARPWCAAGSPPDRWGRACGDVTRILPSELLPILARAAHDALGDGGWIAGINDPYVFLTPEARALPATKRMALNESLMQALVAQPGIARVFDVAALSRPCPPDEDESIDALVCRSTSTLSGDLYVVTRPGSFFDPDVVVGKGSSHGTPYLYDRAVPLVVRAPGQVAAGVVHEEPLGFRTFAATLSALLGVEPPPAARRARTLLAAAAASTVDCGGDSRPPVVSPR